MTINQGYNFGTFKGVFTPSILTILGVVMYLRFGWVLGNVGLTKTLIIVTLSSLITFLTSLSLSSLVTNMRVGKGGAYYIISRSLGIEAGAAIGIPLFIAQALSISFYIAGFSESLTNIFPSISPQVIGILTLIAIAIVTYLSADLALKMQFVIMAFIVLSLISFFLGTPPDANHLVTGEALPKAPFWEVFAVFFPAVTGILAGIAMSGDLKDPSKSLPFGTIAAVLTGYAIYMIIPIFLVRLVPDNNLLITEPFIMKEVALWGGAIVLGLWGASLSSAVGSLLGAPRTLQALALDGVVPKAFAKGYGQQGDPRVATFFAFVIALAGILLGDLNVIAPVLSMFFLTAYGLLNLSAGFEELIGSPSWRPKFRISWKINFLGALGCFSVMFMINALATLVAIFVSILIYYIIERRSLEARWGDVRHGLLMIMARYTLRQLSERPVDIKTWKPNILVMSGSPTKRWYLVELAQALSKGSSMMTLASVLVGEKLSAERVVSATSSIKEFLKKRDVDAFVKVVRAGSAMEGMQALVRAYGFGPISPNTVLVGDTNKTENVFEFSRLIGLICQMKRNLIIVKGGEEAPNLTEGSEIHIWWGGQGNNMGLMLALAHQLQTSGGWNKSKLILKTALYSNKDETSKEAQEAEIQKTKERLEEYIAKERISASAEVVLANDEPFTDVIRKSSAKACLIFKGMRAPDDDESLESFSAEYQNLIFNMEGLPPTAIVFAAQDLNFRKIFSS